MLVTAKGPQIDKNSILSEPSPLLLFSLLQEHALYFERKIKTQHIYINHLQLCAKNNFLPKALYICYCNTYRGIEIEKERIMVMVKKERINTQIILPQRKQMQIMNSTTK